MGKNLAQRMDALVIKAFRTGRHEEQRFCLDIMNIALGRIGFGPKRLKDFEAVFQEAYIEYDNLRETDGKDDRDNWYYKDSIDRELKRYCGDYFEPYEERHKWRR